MTITFKWIFICCISSQCSLVVYWDTYVEDYEQLNIFCRLLSFLVDPCLLSERLYSMGRFTADTHMIIHSYNCHLSLPLLHHLASPLNGFPRSRTNEKSWSAVTCIVACTYKMLCLCTQWRARSWRVMAPSYCWSAGIIRIWFLPRNQTLRANNKDSKWAWVEISLLKSATKKVGNPKR